MYCRDARAILHNNSLDAGTRRERVREILVTYIAKRKYLGGGEDITWTLSSGYRCGRLSENYVSAQQHLHSDCDHHACFEISGLRNLSFIRADTRPPPAYLS